MPTENLSPNTGRAQTLPINPGAQLNAKVQRARNQALRKWAQENGFTISQQGAIPKQIIQRFTETPDRSARIIHATDTGYFVLCPWCAKAHSHSKELGPRTPHCDDGYDKPDYIIVKP